MSTAKSRQIVIEHDPDRSHGGENEKGGTRSGAEQAPTPEVTPPSPAVGSEGFDWDRVITF